MFQVLSKISCQAKDVAVLNSISRILLSHDGSMTKFIESLSNQPMKVRLICSKQLSYQQILELKPLNENMKLKKNCYIVRQTELSTLQHGILVYARSFWCQQAYNKIISKDINKAIGLHLIQQQLQIYRSINFRGKAQLLIDKYNVGQILGRSYSIKHNGQHICQIQEFFTKNLIQMQIK